MSIFLLYRQRIHKIVLYRSRQIILRRLTKPHQQIIADNPAYFRVIYEKTTSKFQIYPQKSLLRYAIIEMLGRDIR